MKECISKNALLVFFAASLHGCAFIPLPPAPGEFLVQHHGLEYSYIEALGGTFKVVNAEPQDLSKQVSETDKARSIFGYPSMKGYPPNTFTYDMSRYARKAEDVARYQSSSYKPAKSSQGAGIADTAVTAGLAGDMSPAGAVGAALVLGAGSVGSKDPRIIMSHLLCFKPVEKFNAAEALKSCWDDFNDNIASAFETWESNNTSFGRQIHSIRIGNTGRARVIVERRMTYHTKGSAPVDRGGYPAHIFNFIVDFSPILDSPYTVENMAAMLDKTKPDSLVYLISSKSDPREREGLEPIGLY